ncbi:MAG: HNH endonuclease signature motif containing protein [Caldilineaceae bacterium]
MTNPPSQRAYIPLDVRRRVAVAARDRCGYCLTVQEYTAMPMHVEHIVPLVAGGTSDEDNLWLACPLCNGYKGTQTDAIDPLTTERVQLFHPRQQNWYEHFRWSEDGITIVGRSAIGRATVIALKLNNEHLTRARYRWVLAGWHPPQEE